ncbi:TPA: transcriptional regulator [Clostridium botulinum]|nr:transcriptional regulator [Clostridium botulinum]HCL4455278.1 transcriptional regulator [Clostridium botulinum]
MPEVLFNKNDYKMLESLIERQCDAPAASLTIKQLMKITEMSKSKIISVKDNFLLMKFISEGAKDRNSKTYYITNEGLNHFKLVFGFTDEDINEMIDNFNKEYNKGE